MALGVAEGGLRFSLREKKMVNRWVCRLAFVGLMMVSVAAMSGCRSMSHGRRGSDGCRGCNQSNQLRARAPADMPMEQGHDQH